MAASQISSSSQLQDRTVEQARPSDTEWQDAQVGCKYVGTFEVGKGKVDRVAVKRGVAVMQQYADKARDAVLIICLEGLKVVDGRTQKVAMAHALARVSMCSVDPNHALFGFVAKNPGVLDKYCHVFAMRKQRHADEVHALVSKAFKLAFTKERTIKQSKGHARSALPGAGPGPAQAAPRAAMGTAPAGRPKRNWAKHNPLQGMNQAPTAAGGGNRLAAPGKASTPAAASPKPLRAARTQDLASAQSGSGLRTAAWYQAGLPREIAMELLELSQDGAFIVRDSQSQPGNFALTMKADNMMHHFIIRSTRGVRPRRPLALPCLVLPACRATLPFSSSWRQSGLGGTFAAQAATRGRARLCP